MSAVDVRHAIAQADLALGTAGLRPDNILRRELRAVGATVAELIEAAKALHARVEHSHDTWPEVHELRAALARCGGAP